MSDKRKYITVYEKQLSSVTQFSKYLFFVLGIVIIEGSIFALATGNFFAKSFGIELGADTMNLINWFFIFTGGTITIIFGYIMSSKSADRQETYRILFYTALFVASLIPLIYGFTFAVQGLTELAIGTLFWGGVIGTADSFVIIYLELIKRDNALGN